MMKRAALAASLLFAASGFAQSHDIAFERAKHLQHGINASIWFAQSPGNYSVERLRSFTTEDDIALMERLGFDHIRLSIDPVPLLRGHSFAGDDTPFMKELDRVVDSMLRHHLAVIVDIHPESPYKTALLNGTEPVQHFTMLWSRLAAHFRSRDAAMLFFEIMNEPEQTDPFRWVGIESAAASAIRRAAPEHTIIATGAHWSGLADLLQTEPIALPNVIYTFHDYEPFPFTHQGATWTDPRVESLRGVPYPSSPAALERNMSQAGSLSGQYFLEEYGLARWDAARVETTIAFAARWSQEHHVPVYCGEFGVLRDYADPTARAAWLHDMTAALGKHGIGWAMWDYQTNFGLVHKEAGQTTPDPLIVDALGLRR